MNEQETAILLADVARRDKREPSRALLAMWHQAMVDVSLDEARAALAILNRESTDYLLPAHIHQTLKRVRADRRRPSLAMAKAAMDAVKACELCDDRGYRLPICRVVCDHTERHAVNARQQVARAIEANR